MDWIETILAGLVFALMVAPLAMLVLTFFVLVPLAHLMPASPMLARARFNCPVSKGTVTASFVTTPGNDHPTDVAACSHFGDSNVLCGKKCLAVATVGWEPSPMVPRYSLVADDTAPR